LNARKAVTSMVLLCYTVNPSDKYDALVEAARLLVILGPQYCGYLPIGYVLLAVFPQLTLCGRR
jgi:hypothetical protein